MNIAKFILAATILSIVVAVPVAHALEAKQTKIELQQRQSKSLQLRVNGLEKKSDQTIEELRQKQDQVDQLQKEKADLETQNKELQARRNEKIQLAEQQRKSQIQSAIFTSDNCESYRPLVAQYFPADQIGNALFTMSKESGCNPNALSVTQDRGLLQINAVHIAKVNGNLNALYDPETNIRVAAQIYSGAGWNAWMAVKNILW